MKLGKQSKTIGMSMLALVTMSVLILTLGSAQVLAAPIDLLAAEQGQAYSLTGSGSAARKTSQGVEKFPSTLQVQLVVQGSEERVVSFKEIWDRLPDKARDKIKEKIRTISNATGVPVVVIARRLAHKNVTIRTLSLSVVSGKLVVGDTEYDVVSCSVKAVPVFGIYKLELQLQSGAVTGSLVIHGRRGNALGKLTLGNQSYLATFKLSLQRA